MVSESIAEMGMLVNSFVAKVHPPELSTVYLI